MSGHFMPRQVLPGEIANLVAGYVVLPVFENNHSGDLFDPLIVGSPDHSNFRYSFMTVNRILDLARGYQHAAGIDHVFNTIDNFYVAVFVDDHEVAGTEPAAHEGFARLVRLVPVARK